MRVRRERLLYVTSTCSDNVHIVQLFKMEGGNIGKNFLTVFGNYVGGWVSVLLFRLVCVKCRVKKNKQLWNIVFYNFSCPWGPGFSVWKKGDKM